MRYILASFVIFLLLISCVNDNEDERITYIEKKTQMTAMIGTSLLATFDMPFIPPRIAKLAEIANIIPKF